MRIYWIDLRGSILKLICFLLPMYFCCSPIPCIQEQCPFLTLWECRKNIYWFLLSTPHLILAQSSWKPCQFLRDKDTGSIFWSYSSPLTQVADIGFLNPSELPGRQECLVLTRWFWVGSWIAPEWQLLTATKTNDRQLGIFSHISLSPERREGLEMALMSHHACMMKPP